MGLQFRTFFTMVKKKTRKCQYGYLLADNLWPVEDHLQKSEKKETEIILPIYHRHPKLTSRKRVTRCGVELLRI